MTLIQSWMDSLSVLKPKNLQLFLMVTLKSILEAYKLMFKYFWWVLLLQLVCYMQIGTAYFMRAFFIAAGLQSLLFFMICAATRPSIVKKNCAYFRSQLFSFLCYMGFLAGIAGIVFVLKLSLPTLFYVLFYTCVPFFILFFLDSEKNIKSYFLSMWYALKMILFNLPLIACAYVALFIFNESLIWIVDLLMSFLNQGIVMLVSNFRVLRPALFFLFSVTGGLQALVSQGILFMPVGICLYANIYIKRLHDQFELYYKQPQ
jgi:hypothetical protein